MAVSTSRLNFQTAQIMNIYTMCIIVEKMHCDMQVVQEGEVSGSVYYLQQFSHIPSKVVMYRKLRNTSSMHVVLWTTALHST